MCMLQYFTMYGPDYSIDIHRGNQPDKNDNKYIDNIYTKVDGKFNLFLSNI